MDFKKALKGAPVLVTGGTGFIGSWLCKRFIELEVSLFMIVRPRRRRETIPLRPDPPIAAKILEGDITDKGFIKRAVGAATPKYVFNLASFTDVSRDPSLMNECNLVNRDGALNLASALVDSGIKRLVHFGTCEEYGVQEVPFTESGQALPVSPYSRSKREATIGMLDIWRETGLAVVVLRPFLTYGPGQDPKRFISQCVRAALLGDDLPMTKGDQTREFNHVDDLVEGILSATSAPGIDGEIINLACGKEYKLLHIANLIFSLASSTGRPIPGALKYREGESMRFFGDIAKCQNLLCYKPKIPIETGLRELVKVEKSLLEGG